MTSLWMIKIPWCSGPWLQSPLAAKNTLKISWTDGNYITIIAQTQREVHGHT